MTLFLLVAGILGAAIVITALVARHRLGLTFRQALLYAPLKLMHRVKDATIAGARSAKGPVVYVIASRSAHDAALALSLLPGDTLHVLDPDDAKRWWLDPYKALARTTVFDVRHILVNRRLKRILKGGGRLAVYLPGMAESSPSTIKLYKAVARTAQATNAAIVPICFSGSDATLTSRRPDGEVPRRLFAPITASALPAETLATTMERNQVQNPTAANALFDRIALARVAGNDPEDTIFTGFRHAAERFGWGRIILEDTVTGSLAFKRLFIGARVIGKRLMAETSPGEAVGVLLPNANGVVVTFLGLLSAGRLPAMLNYTAGPANVSSAIRTARIKVVAGSRAFVEKAQLEPLVTAIEETGAKIIWLEDVRESVTLPEKLLAALQFKKPLATTKAGDAAVILFTSGSEGVPKGVVLSHRNLLVNAHQAGSRFDISAKDTLFNVLPVFHSFGMTGGTVLPILYGVKLFLYPSPLHYKIIPQVARKVKPTIMFGTDTFLAGYARTAQEGDFSSLRFVVAGAEAVKPETRQAYKERFDTLILEGFGMTEASPVVAANTPCHDRPNTVGRLFPGIDVRIEPVEGIDEGGRLWVRGPNVMLGYMTADRPGELQPLADGWHDSGDIVAIDRQGFIGIKGRVKRFAKIAGEMVSLGAVEMLVQGCWPEDRHAVISLPDRRKGERIVLLTTTRNPDRKTLQTYSKQAGAIELMVPNDIIHVDDIPVLGSGKTDYVTAKEKAIEILDKAA